MAGCITEDYRDILIGLLDMETEKAIIAAVVGTIPICPGERISGKSVAFGKLKAPGVLRTVPSRWPSAIYFNEAGEQEPWDSPSGLYKHLTGNPVSGQVCNDEGTSCRALSLVDNFTISGFIVRGNGEPPPPSIGSKSEVEKRHQAWKSHLLETDKKFLVFHPKAPGIQEGAEKAERSAKKK